VVDGSKLCVSIRPISGYPASRILTFGELLENLIGGSFPLPRHLHEFLEESSFPPTAQCDCSACNRVEEVIDHVLMVLVHQSDGGGHGMRLTDQKLVAG